MRIKRGEGVRYVTMCGVCAVAAQQLTRCDDLRGEVGLSDVLAECVDVLPAI